MSQTVISVPMGTRREATTSPAPEGFAAKDNAVMGSTAPFTVTSDVASKVKSAYSDGASRTGHHSSGWGGRVP